MNLVRRSQGFSCLLVGRRNVVLLLLLLLSLPAMAQRTFAVKGRVLDAEERVPLSGVLVRVEGSDLITATNPQGEWLLSLPAGKYTLQFTHLGYALYRHQFEVPLKGATPLRVLLHPEVHELDQVVVTGTGTEHYTKDAPVRTEVLTHKMLREYAGRSVSDLLSSLMPGLDMSQSDMGSRLSLGGLGGGYVVVLVDGKRLSGDVGGQVDLNRLSPNEIERIEVVKGAASSLYGSDAIAGVIHIFTRKHHNIPLYADLSSHNSFLAHNDQRYNGTLSFSFAPLTFTTKWDYASSEGWQNSPQEIYRGVLYNNSTTKTVSPFYTGKVSQEVAWAGNQQWKAAVGGSLYTKEIDHAPGEPRWRSYNLKYIDSELHGDFRYTWAPATYLNIDASYSRHRYYYLYYNTYMDEYFDYREYGGQQVRVPKHIIYAPGDRSMESNQGEWLVHAKGVHRPHEQHLLSAGVEVMGDDLIAPKRMARSQASALTLSLYGQDEWNASERLNFTGGVRVVKHQAFGWTATPKLSGMYRMGKNVNLRGTYSMGFKAPTIKELYYFYERPVMGKVRLYLGNEELKPQHSHYASMGVEYHTKALKGSVTAAYNRVRDMIALVEVPLPPGYSGDEGSDYDRAMKYVNMESAQVATLEASLSWDLGRGLSVGGGYTFTSARAKLVDEEESDKVGHPVIEERMIDGTSTHRGNVRAKWQRSWKRYSTSLLLSGKGQSERHYKHYGNAPAFFLWRLSSTHIYHASKGVTVEGTVGIDNLLDHVERHPYGLNYGTTTPGRSLFVNLVLKWEQGKGKRHGKQR